MGKKPRKSRSGDGTRLGGIMIILGSACFSFRHQNSLGIVHTDLDQPTHFKPVMPDRPLTLGGVKPQPRASRTANASTGPPSVEPNSRNAMLSLVYLSHQTHWMMPDIQDFPEADTLSEWVDLYFENFHPGLPVLHRPTWKTTDVPAVLMLAVAGIGATYADEDMKPITVAIGELVRRMVQWLVRSPLIKASGIELIGRERQTRDPSLTSMSPWRTYCSVSPACRVGLAS